MLNLIEWIIDYLLTAPQKGLIFAKVISAQRESLCAEILSSIF